MPDSNFYSEWKPIRNWLGNFWTEDIIAQAMAHLKLCWGKSVSDGVRERLPSPWICLLVLRWGTIYGASRANAKKPFGSNEFDSAYRRILNLPVQLELLDGGTQLSLWRFIRASFSFQFQYQNDAWFYGLAVLETILKDIRIDYDTEKQFKSATGIELEDFLSLQMLICGGLLVPGMKQTIKSSKYQRFMQNRPQNVVDDFLKFSSLDLNTLGPFLEGTHRKISNPEYEYSLFSDLYRKPFLQFGDLFIPYHLSLLREYVDFGVYDILKKADPGGFSGKFGYGFEKYVKIPLEYSGVEIFDESAIQGILGQGFAVDYVLPFTPDHLLVEVKSAEMYPLLHQNPTKENLKSAFRTSVIKGYCQIFKTAYKMKGREGGRLSSSGSLYGLIVTFKPLNLGIPGMIWEEFMKESLSEFLPQEILQSMPIDPLNIFCLSIHEFDGLCAYAVEKNMSIPDCLKMAAENNRSPDTASFMFFGHLKDMDGSLRSFPHIEAKLKEITNRLRDSYSEDVVTE